MRTDILFPFTFPTFAQDYSERSKIEENDKAYFIELDAPGLPKENLKISVENRHLLVEGEHKGRGIRKLFSLPDDVSVEGIAAKLQDGVLTLALPKKEQARPKQITVQEGDIFQGLLDEKK